MVFSLGCLQKRLIVLRKCSKILIRFQRGRHITKSISICDFAYLRKIIFYTLLKHTTKKPGIPDMLLGHGARSPLQGDSYFSVGLFAEKYSPYIRNYKVYVYTF